MRGLNLRGTHCISHTNLAYSDPLLIRIPRLSGSLTYPDPSLIRSSRLFGPLAYPDLSLIRIPDLSVSLVYMEIFPGSDVPD